MYDDYGMGLGRKSNRATTASQKFRAGSLTYPSDVGVLSRTDHYVEFMINEQVGAKAEFNVGAYNLNPKGIPTRNKGSVPRAPTRRALGSITLYMPSQIQVSQKANYGEAEMGMIVAAGLAGYKGFAGGVKNIDFGAVGETLKKEGANTAASALEGAGATGAKAALAIASGQTTNNRTEMKFEGIDRRSFQFSFRLLPRSSKEAELIEGIVTMFRLHSMPEFTNDSLGRTLKAPSTFDIRYHPEEHLHKIGTCALEAVDVKYGGDRPQFFKDNQPTEVELTMTFKELEIMTKEKIGIGF